MPFLAQTSPRQLVPFLFLPAGLGLITQAITTPYVAQKILAIALFLFCPELARMAWVDLQNIDAVAAVIPKDPKDSFITEALTPFHRVVVSTIVLELFGFYLAQPFLVIGAIIIIFSQLWFNLLAGIQLCPEAAIPVVPLGMSDRKAVLIANAIALSLLCCWPIESVRPALATGLLILITLFLLIKYGLSKTA